MGMRTCSMVSRSRTVTQLSLIHISFRCGRRAHIAKRDWQNVAVTPRRLCRPPHQPHGWWRRCQDNARICLQNTIYKVIILHSAPLGNVKPLKKAGRKPPAGSFTFSGAGFQTTYNPHRIRNVPHNSIQHNCSLGPVSYTHLDVYKRQARMLPGAMPML